MNSFNFSENETVEKPTIALFEQLGWETADGNAEVIGEKSSTWGRKTRRDVVLVSRFTEALQKLNRDIKSEAVKNTLEVITTDRSAVNSVLANREIYKCLKDGVKIRYQNPDGADVDETVRVIDWSEPTNNDFLLVSQWKIAGERKAGRCDLVGFVNGLPLLLIELKKPTVKWEEAYRDNLARYKADLAQLFWYNALIVLSNGSQAKIGSITSGEEHFSDWKRIAEEQEPAEISLGKMIRGTCEKSRLLDLVENFTLFGTHDSKNIKITAKNHQYLGVNKAVAAVQNATGDPKKIGVFWHTQGSGKSYSMVFFAQKVLRKIAGNWTFLVVTDRDDLDDQIYKNFENMGAITNKCQAQSGTHLKQLLTQNHRYIFTMIQKFGKRDIAAFPKLSDRNDIIVMTDEAHRSQYADLAMNMRNALPNARFIGFTGTPLLAEDEKTREQFGEYISRYDFRQSIEDGATVPLYYEIRKPALQLVNEDFRDQLMQLIDGANLTDEQHEELQRELNQKKIVITRDDRLDEIAKDIVEHFMGRADGGKAMVVSIDKQTAVRMYDKVKKYWEEKAQSLEEKRKQVDELKQIQVDKDIKIMKELDMAVVVSPDDKEEEEFKAKGLEIKKHRERMQTEDLEAKFKAAEDRLRMVFVCNMWLTGFDAPCVSTIYLDRPMKNHTLMQTIARANRVYGAKNHGLVVDYIGVFSHLREALKIYTSKTPNNQDADDSPIQNKMKLVEQLRQAIVAAEQFCGQRGVDLNKIMNANVEAFKRIADLDEMAGQLISDRKIKEELDEQREKIIVNDQLKCDFFALVNRVIKLYKAILPDPTASEFVPVKTCLVLLKEKVREFLPEVNITDVKRSITELLNHSVKVDPSRTGSIQPPRNMLDYVVKTTDELFEEGKKHTAAETLRAKVDEKIKEMQELNEDRYELAKKFEELIKKYNEGLAINNFYQSLKELEGEVNEEGKRASKEQLTEEELAIFDLLMRPKLSMTPDERKQTKEVAKKLVETLKPSLVLDWRKRLRTCAYVRNQIRTVLDNLPEIYSNEQYDQTCEIVYDHVYKNYYDDQTNLYQRG